ncbi:MAG: D-alanyl-D-alanine carboxypeptidase [Thermoanaerobaculaceae bacterium]
MPRRVFLFCLLFWTVASTVLPADRRRASQVPKLELVWHVENEKGEVVTSQRAEDPINPASVVKVATSLWALERLGPDAAFETRFFARGGVDWERGRVRGDLVVQGNGDPDFQVENALLVAKALHQMGIREIQGAVVVNSQFWMGWENGSAGTEPDPIKRGLQMAMRLRQALDSHRWNPGIRQTWRNLALRRGWAPEEPPTVRVRGGVGADGRDNLGELLLVHRAKPLLPTLHRFNAYSNNDIERLALHLGNPEELAGMMQARPGWSGEKPRFATLSGLGENRLSPREIVKLFRDLEASCRQRGVELEALLPVAGCHPGTLVKFFPRLAAPPYAGCLIGKTGTLTNTDGGIAVLAGVIRTAEGAFFFCLACPGSQGQLRKARKLQESWLVRFIDEHGGPAPGSCKTALVEADEGSFIIPVAASPLGNAAVQIRR